METGNYTLLKIASLAMPDAGKVLVASTLSTMSFFFSDLYMEGLVAVLMLVIMDTILGVACAKKEKKPITSARFSRSVYKGIVYFTAISAGHFADLTIPFNVVESTLIAFVGVTEFISVMENIGRLGYKTPHALLNQLQDKYVK
jgi:phage-related holin